MADPDSSIVFLLDVDNTLLDNDRLKEDIDHRLQQRLGNARTERFWQLYEQVRRQRDYVDFPRTVQLFTEENLDPGLKRELDDLLDRWPFRSYLYPHTLETIAHLNTIGTTVILSDGDSVFQPLKIRESGLFAAVEGRVLIYVHKEFELPDVFRRYPAGHYVMVDDKPRILSILEQECPVRFTTILVLQGKYAAQLARYQPQPDYTVRAIGDLRRFSRDDFLAPSTLVTRRSEAEASLGQRTSARGGKSTKSRP